VLRIGDIYPGAGFFFIPDPKKKKKKRAGKNNLALLPFLVENYFMF
jgi:hypothetical protein